MEKRQLVLAAIVLGIVGMLVGGVASPVHALSFTGDYFNLSGTHGDTSTNPAKIDGATVTGLVDSALSGTAGTAGSAPTWSGASAPNSGPITDTVGGAHTAIEWWTVHSTGLNVVTADSNPVRSNALNFAFPNGTLFPTGKAGDGPGNGYLSVHWFGQFQVASTAHLTLSADDDAWLFLSKNGGASTLALDNGGVKAVSLSTTSTATLSAGIYTLDLFFADRHVTDAALSFTCDACDPVSAVPEPATLLLFGSTLVGLGAVVRRRMRGTPKESA
jgi:fibro-slime domain-containing protein